MNKAIQWIIGLSVFCVLGFLAWTFVQSLMKAEPGITASVIGALAAVSVGIWTHYSTRRREINSRHFVEKKNAYRHLIDLIFDLFKAQKNSQALSESETLERMLEFKKEVMVWGDQDVIQALENYENKVTASEQNGKEQLSTDDPHQLLMIVDDLLMAIRKDLGHKDTQLKRGSLVGMLVIAADRDKLLTSEYMDAA